MIKRILTFIGAVMSAVTFLASAALGYEKWLLNREPSQDIFIVVIIAMIVFMFPLINSLRYDESDLKPLFKSSGFMKIFSRVIALGLFALTIIGFYICLNEPQIKRGDAVLDEFALPFVLLISWSSMVVYTFGLRVLCSEKFIAISRHPIFIFHPDLLARYLKNKKD